jgi:hypothetical protein
MMLLPFRGHGYLVIVFYVGGLIVTQLGVDWVLGKGVYTARAWPKYLGVGLGALLCWVVGKWLNSRVAPKRVMDLDTGQEFTLPAPSHEFLYVRMEYWGLLGAIASIVLTALSELKVIDL